MIKLARNDYHHEIVVLFLKPHLILDQSGSGDP